MAETAQNQHFSSTLHETRVFPAARKVRRGGARLRHGCVRKAVPPFHRRAGCVLGRGCGRTGLVHAVDEGAGLAGAACEVVCRRQAEPLSQLRGPARAGQARGEDGHPVGGRAGRGTQAYLPRAARGSAAVCECAEGAGREEGRSRRHLHGHDAGAGHRAAGMRAHRRGALGHLRRLCGERAGRPHQRRRSVSRWSRRTGHSGVAQRSS